ncbi:glycine betaine ABC transporter substrate-binding protein [Paracoccus denitrificans]|jgi:osmoprotectant transport system substrate-binding protein|uniref:Substrate-binding region of ABC-type glycine betaine transport system n=1 Tax=Paracoccus denitrificans (strain Pd 1222) TaxID=318586 RepID=A1BBQ4_PARDP|nr:glycine betaine ABC transporter substrate-binding protein [Paracoccus denitrificans]ABL72948.1 Substrate-binding region of ABC-type glycine betaine transport system [Paracoccus denitrificans PD1222]MBB4626426.1 osmoprotectant transport system substrate-binding protein [Paracoccus denitrificans]MCU7427370.1 glycine betaine ABC transporter substrate-binding protein [Paracoccus denitrificans]QAR29349.1 glycine betaine ABC transporter substrate-binding protein [Paracoccus denitrificans]UPV98322
MNIIVKSGLAAFAFAAFATGAQAADIVVGGKNFTEQQILSAITQQVLEANGHRVDNRAGMGSAAVRQAMENGQIDVYWEYTGTSLITYNNIEEKLDPQQTYDTVKELDAQKGIVWLNPSEANNTYALAMRAADASEKGIASISDLAGAINGGQSLTFGSNAEFYARPDGLKPLETAYGFEFGRANVKRMDTGLVYQALRDGQVDVGLVFATDGRIPAFDFTVLEDDQGYFPSYALAPVIRTQVLEANPDIGDLLNEVSAKLDDQVMAALNASVDVDKVSVENAAAKFLQDNGLN